MAGEPSRWPANDRWTNRIHRDDAARFIVFLCNKVLTSEHLDECYIVTDNLPVLLYEVLIWLAKKLNKTVATAGVSKTVEGKRLSNRRMRESGFDLCYPDYTVGYSEIIKGLQNNND
jgi:hypothetical protein